MPDNRGPDSRGSTVVIVMSYVGKLSSPRFIQVSFVERFFLFEGGGGGGGVLYLHIE